MNVDLLPKPLQFFQGLNAEADNFSTDVMKSIAQHLGYPREPLLPHEELSAELRQTLSGMRKQSNQTELEEEAGYLDHLVSFIEHMTELNEHISLLGSETNSLATETTIQLSVKQLAPSTTHHRGPHAISSASPDNTVLSLTRMFPKLKP